jgi:hypothetical protein
MLNTCKLKIGWRSAICRTGRVYYRVAIGIATALAGRRVTFRSLR